MRKLVLLPSFVALAALAQPGLAAGPQSARWQRVDQLPTVVGLDGQEHTASCSGFPGTDPSYRFWVRKGRPDKLAVIFNGGGACWDDFTCSHPLYDEKLPLVVPQFFMPRVRAIDSPARKSGLFDDSRADNPLRDWTMVVLPYCTGDLHAGMATLTYHNAPQPGVRATLPDEFEIRHGGFDNFMVALDWIRGHLAAPQRVLVAGDSAGGYASILNHPWLQKLYPQATMAVLADSAQGVTSVGFDYGLPGRQSWNMQVPTWVFGSDFASLRGSDFLGRAAQASPQVRFAQYSRAQDSNQAMFYGYMKQYYGPGGNCAQVTADWNEQMLAIQGTQRQALPNFRDYVAPGTEHTIIGSDAFYDKPSWGPSMASWVSDLLNAPTPAWKPVACPDCLNPLPCP